LTGSLPGVSAHEHGTTYPTPRRTPHAPPPPLNRPVTLLIAARFDARVASELGEVLIRCNNVLYIRGVPEEDES
jgi:hypothetical protein